MICPNCNSNIPNNSIFCKYCGCKISDYNSYGNYNRNIQYNNQQYGNTVDYNRVMMKILIFGAILLLVYTFLFFSRFTTVYNGEKLTFDNFVNLVNIGEDLSWENLSKYNYSFRNNRAKPNYHRRFYYFDDEFKNYNGAVLTMKGDINKTPEVMELCLYKTYYDELEHICEITANIRNEKEFENFVQIYKQELKPEEKVPFKEYRYNFRKGQVK